MESNEAVKAEKKGNISNHTIVCGVFFFFFFKKAVIEKRIIKDKDDAFNALLSSIKSTRKSKQILE